MAETLTRRQRAIYDFLVERVRGRGIPPTLTEIASAFGLASPSGVADHLKALERKGWIRRRPGISRGIEILRDGSGGRHGVRVPVLGCVPSRNGLRTPARAPQHLVLDGRVVPDEAVAVRAELAGLEGRGILRGDLLVLRRGRVPRRGELVVVRVGRRIVLAEVLDGGRFRRLDTEEDTARYLDGGCEPVGPVVAVLRSMIDRFPDSTAHGPAGGRDVDTADSPESRHRRQQERMSR